MMMMMIMMVNDEQKCRNLQKENYYPSLDKHNSTFSEKDTKALVEEVKGEGEVILNNEKDQENGEDNDNDNDNDNAKEKEE